MFGSGNHGILHVQVAVIGIHRPTLIETVSDLCFDACIVYLSRILVQHTASARIGQGHNQVLAIDIEEIDTIRQASTQQSLREGYLVVPHRFRLQVGILRREHVHLTENRITETFGGRSLQFDGMRQVECQSGLRQPFCSDTGMMINAQSCVEREPVPDILPEVHIACHLVFMLIHQIATCSRIFSAHIFAPCLATVTEPVEAYGDAVILEEPGALIP